MRLAPRLAAALTVLVLTAAGCGGADVAYREVPGDPVDLQVPGDGQAVTGAATPTPTPDAEATETPDADAQAEETAVPEATAAPETAPETTEGAAEAPAPEDDTTTETPPPAGAPEEQFEDYCAENPGAC